MYRHREDIVLREVHGSVFLIDITDDFHSARCYLHELNPVARFIWEHIPEAGTVEGVCDLLQKELLDPVPREVLVNDITLFVKDLADRGYLVWEDDHA